MEEDFKQRLVVLETKMDMSERQFTEYKAQVRDEFTSIDTRLRDIAKSISAIDTNIDQIEKTIAKYLGIGIAAVAVIQFLVPYVFK